jgi:Transcription factor WhiB
MANPRIANRISYQNNSWLNSALCAKRGIDPDLFFQADTNATIRKRLLRVCTACPVRPICLEKNLRVPFGMYGGLTYRERVREAQRRGLTMRRLVGTSFADDDRELYQRRSIMGSKAAQSKRARKIKNTGEANDG